MAWRKLFKNVIFRDENAINFSIDPRNIWVGNIYIKTLMSFLEAHKYKFFLTIEVIDNVLKIRFKYKGKKYSLTDLFRENIENNYKTNNLGGNGQNILSENRHKISYEYVGGSNIYEVSYRLAKSYTHKLFQKSYMVRDVMKCESKINLDIMEFLYDYELTDCYEEYFEILSNILRYSNLVNKEYDFNENTIYVRNNEDGNIITRGLT